MRIVSAILVLMLLAILLIVGITLRVLMTRADNVANIELSHEAAKFRSFASSPDPHTGEIFPTVELTLTGYLAHNVAEPTELLFSIVNGKADRRSLADPLARVDTDAAFVAEQAAATTPRTGRITTTAGPAVYAALPIRESTGPRTGVLVVVEFLEPAYREARTTAATISIVGTVALLITAIAGWMVAGRVLAPLRKVRATADRISESDLTGRIDVTGRDDVAMLAATFNRMLDRLESAFEGQRRFLEDASHELRTPLTIIRGQLSVMGDDPLERTETLRLVDDELKRMSILVDDLLTLASSERPDFIRPSPVDVADLLVETLAKVTPLGERAWSINALPEGTVCLDRARITQALIQLASNAVKFTQEGDKIRFGARTTDRLRLWVSDTGSGIPLHDQPRIFERFSRGTHTTDVPGRGLGLAIVSKIAEGHGGTVQLVSTPGIGTTVTLDLPLETAIGS